MDLGRCRASDFYIAVLGAGFLWGSYGQSSQPGRNTRKSLKWFLARVDRKRCTLYDSTGVVPPAVPVRNLSASRMSKEKRIEALMKRARTAPKSLALVDLITLAEAYGFELDRTRGSHGLYSNPRHPHFLNLNPYRGEKNAKPYQVKQFLSRVADLEALGD